MTSRRDSYTAVLFLAGLLTAVIFLGLGTLPQAQGFREALRPARETSQAWAPARETRFARPIVSPRLISLPSTTLEEFREDIDAAEPALNALLDRDHAFIQLYGGAQRLMLRDVVEDVDPKYTVVRLDEELLTFANLDARREDMAVHGKEMAEFAHRLEEELELPFLYVQAPSKLNVSPLPDGLADYSDAEADQFLSVLEKEDVDTLDLRPAFQAAVEEGEAEPKELFFRTDHHWTPAGAFLAYQNLCDKLRSDYDFTILKEITDPRYYNKYTFEEVFLGSQGKRVGSLYAGVDSIEIWSPVFETDFSYTVPMSGIQRRGTFVTSLLFPELLAEKGLYDANPYVVYSGGDFLLSRAVNLKSPYAPRILVLRDSFGCALTPFLSLISGEVMAVDPRSFEGDQDDMVEYIDWLDPDLVIVLNTTGSLRVDELYPYLPTAAAEAKAAKNAEGQTDVP